jgi:hypothetical protein
MYFLYYMYYIYIQYAKEQLHPSLPTSAFFLKRSQSVCAALRRGFSSARGSWIPSEGDGHPRAKGFVGLEFQNRFGEFQNGMTITIHDLLVIYLVGG